MQVEKKRSLILIQNLESSDFLSFSFFDLKTWTIFFLMLFGLSFSYGQSNSEAIQHQNFLDSLKKLYFQSQENNPDLLIAILQEDANPDSMIKYGKILLDKSLKDTADLFTFQAFLHLGNGYVVKGELSKGLEHYFEGMKYAEKADYEDGIGKLFISIANAYSQSENSQNAAFYYGKSIAILRNGNDSLGLASAIFNAGDEYLTMGKLDSALLYTQEAQVIFGKVNYPLGEAYCYGNMGMIFAKNGNNTIAEESINRAIAILEEYKDYYPISVYLEFMSSIYLENGDLTRALNYAERSLKLASQYGIKDQISESNLALSKIYEQEGNTQKAFDYYKNHILYRDSVNNISAVQEMANMRTDYEVSQKQVEVDLLEKESLIKDLQTKRQQFVIYGVMILLALVALLAFVTYRRYRFEKETKQIIELEKNRSEELLLNILPAETAEELKENGAVMAERIESVSVLFTDFKSFSSIAEHVSP